MGRRISPELEKIIEGRNTFITSENTGPIKVFYEDENLDSYTTQVITPIVMQGDPIGSIILLSREPDVIMGNLEIKLLETAAKFLSKQMET